MREEGSPGSEGGLERLPKASFFPGITGTPVSLAIGELAAQPKWQSGGTVPRKSRAHPGECGVKPMHVPCSVHTSPRNNPDPTELRWHHDPLEHAQTPGSSEAGAGS